MRSSNVRQQRCQMFCRIRLLSFLFNYYLSLYYQRLNYLSRSHEGLTCTVLKRLAYIASSVRPINEVLTGNSRVAYIAMSCALLSVNTERQCH